MFVIRDYIKKYKAVAVNLKGKRRLCSHGISKVLKCGPSNKDET